MSYKTPASYVLPQNQRKHFNVAIGELYRSEADIIKIINEMKADSTIPRIVSVGDATTLKLLKYSLIPNLAIIDEYVERKKAPVIDTSKFTVIHAQNPAAHITSEAWSKIRNALKSESNKIIIKITGEEDLLTLPAVLESPLNSKVLYGLPREGLVLVTVTEERKKVTAEYMKKLVKINGN